MTTAIYAGSFDPFHCGHLAIATLATRCFDHVVIAITANPDKPTRRFTADERVCIARASTDHLSDVEVVVHDGLVADLARERRAVAFVRNMGKEQVFELQMAVHNHALAGVPTVFFTPDPEAADISSTQIRQLLADGRIDAASALVAASARPILHALSAASTDRLPA